MASSSPPLVTAVAVSPPTIQQGNAAHLALSATIEHPRGESIAGAEYRVGSGPWGAMRAAGGRFDSAFEIVEASLAIGIADAAGVYRVEIRAKDAAGRISEIISTYYIIVDSSSGPGNGG